MRALLRPLRITIQRTWQWSKWMYTFHGGSNHVTVQKKEADMRCHRPERKGIAEMTEAKPYVNFDPVAQDYDISRGIPPEAQLKISARMRDAAAWQPGDTFLDAGTGTGRFSVPLARLGVPVVGIEISANMLAKMRANLEAACRKEKAELPLRAVRGDLRRLPVLSGAFQAVVVVHILHLIADWKAVLAEIQRVLKPGGVLLMGRQGGQGSPSQGRSLRPAHSTSAWQKNADCWLRRLGRTGKKSASI